VGVLSRALGLLREEGYEVVSLSGGEPLVYRPVDRLAAAAAELGYRVHAVTNGLLLTKARLAALREHIHLFAVSLDGAEDTHNRVRGRKDAFAKAMRALRVLAESDVPFGIAFGVSAMSLGDVPWAYETARDLGASLLHLRPLAPEGRAQEMADEWMLTESDCARLVVISELLGQMGPGAPRVQIDLVPTAELADGRQQFELLRAEPAITRLSDALNPLVIDEQGRLLPFTYGIDGRFALGNITELSQPGVIPRSLDGYASVRTLLDRAFAEAARSPLAYLDWFAHLTRVSREADAAVGLEANARIVHADQ
jgi:MoaA/NifB/PqqE/SkfB family radical SAM enzyme